MISKVSNSRNILIDYMKVIGMYLIILGHSNPPAITDIVYGVSVPLFFFLSGYLHRDHEWRVLVEKIFVYMYLPAVFMIILRNIFAGYSTDNVLHIILVTLKNSLLGYHGVNHGGWGIMEGWFVYSLIVLLMMHKVLGLKKFTILLPVLALICIVCSRYDLVFYNAIPNALLCSFFFVGGCWINRLKTTPPDGIMQ